MGFQPFGTFIGDGRGNNRFSDLYVDSLWLSHELRLMDKAAILSNNFVSGSAGFKLEYDGSAEFNDVIIRGDLESSNYVAGTSGYFLDWSTGSAEFNDVVVRGDVESGNWDGASPANLATVDTGATAGFYLDASVGAAQFEGNLYVNGDFLMDSDGTFKVKGSNVYADPYAELSQGLLELYTGAFSASQTPMTLTIADESFYVGSQDIQIGMKLLVTGAPDIRWYNVAPVSVNLANSLSFELDSGEAIHFGSKYAEWPTDTHTKYVSINSGGIDVLSGSAGNPPYSFIGDADTGLFRYSTNAIGFATGGANQGRVDSLGNWYFGSGGTGKALIVDAASAANPTYTFEGDTDLGIYRPGADSLGFVLGSSDKWHWEKETGTTNPALALRAGANPTAGDSLFEVQRSGGVSQFTIETSGLIYGGPNGGTGWGALDGGAVSSSTNPGLTFSGDPGTGIGRPAANQLAFILGGTSYGTLTSTYVIFAPIYNDTTGSAANMFVNTNGRIYRSTSARKYKSRITYNVDYLADITLTPAKFYRKDDKAWSYGFIADDLGDQDKLLGEWDEDEIENYDQRAVMAVMAAKINRLESRLTALEEQL